LAVFAKIISERSGGAARVRLGWQQWRQTAGLLDPAACLYPSYGPDTADIFRRSASYVDRILKGEPPGNLPTQSPAKFELVVNLKKAKALRLSIRESFLLLADEVIE
jgi:hypothetical protein